MRLVTWLDDVGADLRSALLRRVCRYLERTDLTVSH